MITLPENRPLIMGILNVTPDSFSDGGLHLDPDQAVGAAMRMMEEGADLIDVGGESTRPKAADLPLDEELARVLPVIEALSMRRVPFSMDTRKPGVAAEAIARGASMINDVSGFRDPMMIQTCAASGCAICIMHMLGTPATMQSNPTYEDVVGEVRDWLMQQAEHCQRGGIAVERIFIDPGIGFGKTLEHNLQLLRALDVFVETGYPVLIGVSRKSFIGRIIGSEQTPAPVDERLEGSLAAQVLAQAQGAKVLRVHDVRAARRAAEVAAAILG
jgi:dihydropteroate synthase